MAVALMAAAMAPSLAVVVVALFCLGATGTAVIISAQTGLQLIVDDAMSGRIMALCSVGFLGPKPIGGIVAAWPGDLSGPHLRFAVGGIFVGWPSSGQCMTDMGDRRRT